MAIAVYWDKEAKTCLRVDLCQPWNWREFREATEEAKTLLENEAAPIGMIVDVRQAGDLPPAGFLVHSRNSLHDLPLLPIAFVANTPIMQIICQPIQQLFRTRRPFYFVRSIEEAREILKQSHPEA